LEIVTKEVFWLLEAAEKLEHTAALCFLPPQKKAGWYGGLYF